MIFHGSLWQKNDSIYDYHDDNGDARVKREFQELY